jgi:hypothetical protein
MADGEEGVEAPEPREDDASPDAVGMEGSDDRNGAGAGLIDDGAGRMEPIDGSKLADLTAELPVELPTGTDGAGNLGRPSS